MGANNPRKPFGAELADPYANADEIVRPYVDAALRVVCQVRIKFENIHFVGTGHTKQVFN